MVCEGWNDEIKMAVDQWRIAFEEGLQARSVVANDNNINERNVVKRVVWRANRDPVAKCGNRLSE